MFYPADRNHLTDFVRLVCFVDLVYNWCLSACSEVFQSGIATVYENFGCAKSDFYVVSIALNHLIPIVESELYYYGVCLFAFGWEVLGPEVGNI